MLDPRDRQLQLLLNLHRFPPQLLLNAFKHARERGEDLCDVLARAGHISLGEARELRARAAGSGSDPDGTATLAGTSPDTVPTLLTGTRRDRSEARTPAPESGSRRSPTAQATGRPEDERAARERLCAELAELRRGEPLFAPHAELVLERGEVLGEGGMGQVLRVRDHRLSREAALKMLLPDEGEEERRAQLIPRFLREAQLTARLDHPAVPPIYEAGVTARGKHYILMRLVDGETLSARIKAAHRRRDKPLRALLEALAQVAEGVAYAHSRGIIHRDLKPDNVMVGAFGEVVILDWGIAREVTGLDGELDDRLDLSRAQLAPEASGDSELTQGGAIIGTLGYMPPEQADGIPADARADVFALGAILTEVLTGRPPLVATSMTQGLIATTDGAFDAPRDIDPRAPGELDALARRALAPNREARLESAAAFAEELRRYLRGEDLEAYDYSASERALRAARRHPTRLVGGALALILSAAFGGALLWQQQRARTQTAERQRAFEAERRELAEAARAAAEASQASSEQARRATRGALITNLIAQGDLLADSDPQTARSRYEEALAAGAELGEETPRAALDEANARLGLWDLRRKAPRPLMDIPTLERAASLAFSADGRRLAIGHAVAIEVWDLLRGQRLASLTGAPGVTQDLAFDSADSDLLISASGTGEVWQWEVTSGRCLRRLPSLEDSVEALAAHGPWLLTLTSSEGEFTSWDAESGLARRSFYVGSLTRSEVTIDPLRRRSLWIGAGQLHEWDLEAHRELTATRLRDGVSCFALDPTGEAIAVGLREGGIALLERATGARCGELEGLEGRAWQLRYREDGGLVAVTAAGAVGVWRPGEAQVDARSRFEGGRPEDLILEPRGRIAAGVLDEARVRVWSLERSAEAREVARERLAVESLIAPRGNLLITGERSGRVRLWELETGASLDIATLDDPVTSVALSPDGSRLAATCAKGGGIWSLTGEPICAFDEDLGAIQSVAFAGPDELWLGSAGLSVEELSRLNKGDPTQLRAFFARLASETAGWERLILQPDGRVEAQAPARREASQLTTLLRWDATRRAVVARGSCGAIHALAPLEDGRVVSFGQAEGASLWSRELGDPVAHLHRDEASLTKIVSAFRWGWRADGSPSAWFAAGARAVALVDLDRGELVWRSEPVEAAIVGAAPGPVAGTVMSAHDDGRLRLWSPLQARPVRILEGEVGALQGLASAEGGQRLILASDARLSCWELSPRAAEVPCCSPEPAPALSRELARRFADLGLWSFAALAINEGAPASDELALEVALHQRDWDRVEALSRSVERLRSKALLAAVARTRVLDEAWRLVRAALRQGRPADALPQLSRILQQAPRDLDARLTRAQIFEALGLVAEALAAYRELRDLDPDRVITPRSAYDALCRGQRAASLGQWERALEAYDEVLAISLKTQGIHLQRGQALRHLERWDEALDASLRAYEEQPAAAETRIELAQVFIHFERWREAFDLLAPVVTSERSTATAARLLGDAALGLGILVDAESAYAAVTQAGAVQSTMAGVPAILRYESGSLITCELKPDWVMNVRDFDVRESGASVVSSITIQPPKSIEVTALSMEFRPRTIATRDALLAQYGLARVHARKARAASPAEAARLREQALQALEQAVELGFVDFEAIDLEEDFAELRGEPAFRGLFKPEALRQPYWKGR